MNSGKQLREIVLWAVVLLLVGFGCFLNGAGRWFCFIFAPLVLLYRRDFQLLSLITEALQKGFEQLRESVTNNQAATEAKLSELQSRVQQLELLPRTEAAAPREFEAESTHRWVPVAAVSLATIAVIGIIWTLSTELRRVSANLALSEVRLLQNERKIASLEGRGEADAEDIRRSAAQLQSEVAALRERLLLLNAKIEPPTAAALPSAAVPMFRRGPGAQGAVTSAKAAPPIADQTRARFSGVADSKAEPAVAAESAATPFQSYRPASTNAR